MNRHNISPDRAFGQNFLIDQNAMETIVEAAELKSRDTVLEVGPGLGVLTQELADQARYIIAVEADARLLPALKETLQGVENVNVILEDALRFDLKSLPPDSSFVSNLPYNISNPLLRSVLQSCQFKRAVILIQSEVADRLLAEPGTKTYGALTIFCRYFARVRKIRNVSPSCFLPKPNVTSSIVRLDMRKGVTPDPDLFMLVRQGFRHRRKTLASNLFMAGYRKQAVVTALRESGANDLSRAEELSLKDFRNLRRTLQS
jgi:16S rRNA (adenine1518-N6/adenine1519-N6)-dimethyltransferase